MMINCLVDFKNNVIKRFGPVLGYAILIVGGLAALSVLGFLLKSIIKMIITLAIASVVVYGVYRLYEYLSSKKKD